MVDETEYEVYKNITYILGLKVIPSKENEIREKAEELPEISKSFKALGQFDVILMVKGSKDIKSLTKQVRAIDNVLDVFLIELV